MRAKEFAERFTSYQGKFQDSPILSDELSRDIAAGVEIIQDLIAEMGEILKSRGGNSSLIPGICREQRMKWVAIVKLINNTHVKEDLYDFVVRKQFPELSALDRLVSMESRLQGAIRRR